MSITPLCTKFSAVQIKTPTRRPKYESPVNFASALRPLYSGCRQTLVKRCLQVPARTGSEVAVLRVRKFQYAPKSRFLGPVSFNDIPRSRSVAKRQVLQPLDLEQETHHILAQSQFFDALIKRQADKAMSHRRRCPNRRQSEVVYRRHPQPFDPVEFDRPNRKVKRRSIPFNESTETDPFMLFQDLQLPNSAMENDSVAYIEQTQEVEVAKEQRYRARRGSPLKPDEIRDLIHMTLKMGIYASPEKHPATPSEPIDKRSYSLMDID